MHIPSVCRGVGVCACVHVHMQTDKLKHHSSDASYLFVVVCVCGLCTHVCM